MKGVCGFCGHSDAPETLRPQLQQAIATLINSGQADTFYVGNHGAFDRMAAGILSDLQRVHPQIRYAVVLAYLPTQKTLVGLGDVPTIYPEGLELVPKRYAIVHRNRWIAEQSDTMIAYVTHSFGGAAQTLAYARRKGVVILNLVDGLKIKCP